MTTTEARQALIDKDPNNSYIVTETLHYDSAVNITQRFITDYRITLFRGQAVYPCEQVSSNSLEDCLTKAFELFSHAIN